MCIDKDWQSQFQNLADDMERARAKAFKLPIEDGGFLVANAMYENRCTDLTMYVHDTFGTPAFFVNFLKQELRDATPDKTHSESFINRYKWDVKTDLTTIGYARSLAIVFKYSFLEAQSQIAAAQVHGITSFARPLVIA